MSGRRTAAALGFALALGACFHARHVERADEEERGGDQGRGAGEKEQGGSARATASRVPPRAGRPAVASSPSQLMNPGSIRRIQEALRGKGLLEGAPSGELDEATSAGVRRFQRSEGLAETGVPDRETLRRLGVDPKDVYRTVPEGAEADPGR